MEAVNVDHKIEVKKIPKLRFLKFEEEWAKKNFDKVEFLLPCKKEQEKIITLLKKIDDSIETTEIQLTQTQQFKKGLLQQMFV